MTGPTPIFEQSTSPLYSSNDGRLRSEDTGTEYVLALDGTEVMRTLDRTLVDAYIAGYDLRDARDEYGG